MSDTGPRMLKEDEIRPEGLMQDQAKRFAADLARMLNRRSEFVVVACPACGMDRAVPEFEKHTLAYVRCLECRTVYISPRPTPSVLDEYYGQSENYRYWNQYIFPASEGARREKIFKPRAARLAELCRRHGTGTDVLLEVGAGFGTFCEEVQRLGLFRKVLAVERTPELAATCRKRGIDVLESSIEDAHIDVVPNVIASFEVIEHLFEPRTFVLRCAQLLAPGGLLVLTCPNIAGFDVATLGPLSDAVDPEHLNYFNPASLAQLLTSCGLNVLEVQTPGRLDAELVRKRVLSGELDLARQPFLQRVLVDEWDRLAEPFQMFLAEHGLSSHMWIVGRK